VWNRELADFSGQYRAIAYSRRYNSPNTNSIRPGHSAIGDADDLAAFIKTLNLGPVHIVGHSYGALTTLFLATRHPELLRTIVLAEPPAVALLAHLPPERAAAGRATLADIETRVRQIQSAWRSGDREEGMRIFFTWHTGNPALWDGVLPEGVRQDSRRNFAEWDAVLLSGELFPSISAQAIEAIGMPALVVSGANTTPYLATIAEEITRLLQPRGGKHVVISRASHVNVHPTAGGDTRRHFRFSEQGERTVNTYANGPLVPPASSRLSARLILEKPVSDRGTLEDISQSRPTVLTCSRKLLILNGEMLERSIRHAWKAILASLTARHRNTSLRIRFNGLR
jgi:pimeloyl-ACP methyl ester carboxylesterase